MRKAVTPIRLRNLRHITVEDYHIVTAMLRKFQTELLEADVHEVVAVPVLTALSQAWRELHRQMQSMPPVPCLPPVTRKPR
jgi:hypothetical protein